MNKFVIIPFVLLALVGCGNKIDDATQAACEEWAYIYFSDYDTVQTVNQGFELNTRRENYCKGVKPKPLFLGPDK